MMGRDDPAQRSLFYTPFSFEKRVRGDHPLRQLARVIDFTFTGLLPKPHPE